VLQAQHVPYGGSAKAPVAPSREGYTFQGWSRGLSGITEDTVIEAEYLIKTHTVKFLGSAGQLISTQLVPHGSSATLPNNPTPPSGHVFVEWESDDWQNVTKNTTVNAVFALEHPDLPVGVTILSATRDTEAGGYVVSVQLQNWMNSVVKGKTLTALKTEGGKMVDSETESFSLGASDTATREIYVPYEGVASKVEVSVVGVAAGNNTGAPLSVSATSVVDMGENWSAWSTDVPAEGLESESRVEYRARNKKSTTGSSPVLPGWDPAGQSFVWSAWSPWSKTQPAANADREIASKSVETKHNKTQWHYGRYWYNNNINTAANPPASGSYWFEASPWYDYQFTLVTTFSGGSQKYKDPKSGAIWYRAARSDYGSYTRSVYSHSTYHNEWQYRDKVWTYKFEQWGDWSEWSPEPKTGGEVESRTVHRFKNAGIYKNAYNYKRYRYQNMSSGAFYYTYSAVWPDSQGWPGAWEYDKRFVQLPLASTTPEGVSVYGSLLEPWYRADLNDEGGSRSFFTQDTLEDTSGQERIVSGRIDAPGRLATLMVFKGSNTDPTASQLEYVTQSQLGPQGEYEFRFIPREDPRTDTGDFHVMIGVEGGTGPVLVDTIAAPRPNYAVKFVAADGEVLDTVVVPEGGSAAAPEAPEREGMEFVGWSTGTTNVRDDLIVVARYVARKYAVAFVNDYAGTVDVRSCPAGEPLVTPSVDAVDGHEFLGWADDRGSLVETASADAVLFAAFEPHEYNVTYLGVDGDVIGEFRVAHGEAAPTPAGYAHDDSSYLLPEGEESTSTAPVNFAGWGSEDELNAVTSDLVVAPVLQPDEYASNPEVDVPGDAYTEPQHVALDTATEGAVVVYTLDGSEPSYGGSEHPEELVGQLYAGDPVLIQEDTILKATAFADGMASSSTLNAEYLIRDGVRVDVGSSNAAYGAITGGGVLPKSTMTTVTAEPSAGNYFVRWSEGGVEVTTTAEYGFLVDDARSLVAEFSPKPAVSAAPNDSTLGNVSGTGIYDLGDSATVQATPIGGARFVEWRDASGFVSQDPAYSFPVDRSVGLTAVFAPSLRVKCSVPSVSTRYARVSLAVPADTIGISSVSYRVDDGPVVKTQGATAYFAVHELGVHSVEYWCEDARGNLSVRDSQSFTVSEQTILGLKPSTFEPAYNAKVTLSATLKSAADGSGLAGQRILFERRDGTKWSHVGSADTDSRGAASLSVTPSRISATSYRARYSGVPAYLAISSSSVSVKSRVDLQNPKAPSKMRRGAKKTVYGYMLPRHTSGTSPVRLYLYRYEGGRWKSYGYVKAKASDLLGYTKYSAKISFPKTGSWRVRAYAPADTAHAATWSPSYDVVKVVK